MNAAQRLTKDLGQLHDANITKFTWEAGKQTFTLHIDDLYSNFEGLPEYPGQTPATITFKNVAQLETSIDLKERLWIYSWEFLDEENRKVALIGFTPGGRMRIVFSDLEIEEHK